MQQSEAGARPVFTSDEAVTYGLAFLASVTGAADPLSNSSAGGETADAPGSPQGGA